MSTATPAYLEIIDIIAAGATPAAAFRPSAEAQERVATLIEREKDGTLSADEKAEFGTRKPMSHPSGEIVRLFNPRRDRWRDHFRIDGQLIEPLTRVGAVTM